MAPVPGNLLSRRWLRPAVTVVVAGAVLLGAGSSGASGLRSLPAAAQSEGCFAQNPGHPTCTARITSTPTTELTGWWGVGDWSVTIHRGKRVIKVRSDAPGEPPLRLWRYRVGDRVHAAALSPGSVVSIGHISPP